MADRNPDELKCLNATKMAVMGCVYGNVPAFRRCIEDARAVGCDLFVCLGDVIGCSGHSDEVIDLAVDVFDVFVAGNLEQQVVAGAAGCGCGYDSSDEQQISNRAFRHARASLSEDRKQRIREWSDRVLVHTRADSTLCCHGSPDRTNEFLYESTTSTNDLSSWLDAYDATGLFCAHTGLPWDRTWSGRNGRRFAANIGAVGKPDHDGDPAVHYAVLPLPDKEFAAPEIRRVEYDYRSWCRQLRADGVDEIFIEPLRTGRWTYGLETMPDGERSPAESATGQRP